MTQSENLFNWQRVKTIVNALQMEKGGGHYPAIFLQRPKWITDDASWNTLCKSVRLELPNGFELK